MWLDRTELLCLFGDTSVEHRKYLFCKLIWYKWPQRLFKSVFYGTYIGDSIKITHMHTCVFPLELFICFLCKSHTGCYYYIRGWTLSCLYFFRLSCHGVGDGLNQMFLFLKPLAESQDLSPQLSCSAFQRSHCRRAPTLRTQTHAAVCIETMQQQQPKETHWRAASFIGLHNGSGWVKWTSRSECIA